MRPSAVAGPTRGEVDQVDPMDIGYMLGIDVSGTVVAVGSAVTRFALGDEVFGFGKGTFAEYAVAREDRLARKPVNLSFQQAAVVPISAATALQALDAVGGIRSGHVALVIGASGGVGSYAVQLANAVQLSGDDRRRDDRPARLERVGAAAAPGTSHGTC